MRLIMTCALVLVVVAGSAGADNLFREAGDAVVENVELSLVGGSAGIGVATYWPVWRPLKRIELFEKVTVGPFVVLGHEAAGAGVGAKVPFSVDLPLLNLVDFGGIARLYDFDSKHSAWQWVVGRTVPLDLYTRPRLVTMYFIVM